MNKALRIFLGTAIGGAVGFSIGYFGQCATGTCSLTGNPWISTIIGLIIGARIASRK
jgi:hypothetical protein